MRAKLYDKFKGTDPRNKIDVNSKAAKYWQYRYRKFGKKKGEVLVKDVVAYYQKRRTYRDFIRDDKDKLRHGHKLVLVNAALFFTPDQVLDMTRSKRQSRKARYGPFRAVAGQLGTAQYSRTKVAQKMCAKYSWQKYHEAQAKIQNCFPKVAKKFLGQQITKIQYNEALRKCQRKPKLTVVHHKRGWLKRNKSTRKAVNKQINAIARRLENRNYIQRESKRNVAGLAFIDVRKGS